jgi:hypothetical protein
MSNLRRSQISSISLNQSGNLDSSNPVVRDTNEAIEKAKNANGILDRLWPNPNTRAVNEGEVSLVQREYEFKKEELEMLRKAKLEALQEMCNQYLAQGKAGIRAEMTEFMLREHQKLQTKLDKIFNEFMDDLETKYREIDNVSRPSLQKIRSKKVEQDCDRFMQLYDGLVDGFDNIIQECKNYGSI